MLFLFWIYHWLARIPGWSFVLFHVSSPRACEHNDWSLSNSATGNSGALCPEGDFNGRCGALIPAKSRGHVDWTVIRPIQLLPVLVLLHVVCYRRWVQTRVRRGKNKLKYEKKRKKIQCQYHIGFSMVCWGTMKSYFWFWYTCVGFIVGYWGVLAGRIEIIYFVYTYSILKLRINKDQGSFHSEFL